MEENVFEKKIKNLKEKFIEIKKLGYIKSMYNGKGGVGNTFEILLGNEPNLKREADYDDIEIKTRTQKSTQNLTLFSCMPKISENAKSKLCGVEYLVNKCGYLYKNIPNTKAFVCTTLTTKIIKTHNDFGFLLNINEKEEKIILYIFDKKNVIIDRNLFWDFKDLNEILLKKLKYLAIINAKSKIENNYYYYKYEHIAFYKLVSFENFIDLIKNGQIAIVFNIGCKKNTETNEYVTYYHGIRFDIEYVKIKKLFSIIDTY